MSRKGGLALGRHALASKNPLTSHSISLFAFLFHCGIVPALYILKEKRACGNIRLACQGLYSMRASQYTFTPASQSQDKAFPTSYISPYSSFSSQTVTMVAAFSLFSLLQTRKKFKLPFHFLLELSSHSIKLLVFPR
ncbi:hypothetical protein P3X46_023436 [Hevea brasiliensis]|uniref:NADH:quinone oxidoreductase/Mrp antiporter membrane subunit domain-containing protein n=1 Tax=Hevea brasiliensis TaxID=3981 RepID=A0ABQ9LAY1_HEVBR|nr:hypothetical protein P3X46_023436 [Hevea brasiliensis]